MNGRCRDKGHSKYGSYGGKGIRVCNIWRRDFHSFRTWALNNGYHPDLSIDRIDPDDDYMPKNCRWIPMDENRKRARFCIGEGHYKSVLTEAIILDAHKRRAAGETIVAIARHYNVPRRALGQALRGDTWKHLRACVDFYGEQVKE
ncbi:MAG: hypothetical protein GY938_03260 [Ketobacter sp.]|nr:hypothetical protein [Ketobacter sp.]